MLDQRKGWHWTASSRNLRSLAAQAAHLRVTCRAEIRASSGRGLPGTMCVVSTRSPEPSSSVTATCPSLLYIHVAYSAGCSGGDQAQAARDRPELESAPGSELSRHALHVVGDRAGRYAQPRHHVLPAGARCQHLEHFLLARRETHDL